MTWFKDGFYWRKESPSWEKDNYGFSPDGLGDLISNTCMKIMDDDDYSDWAYESLSDMSDLLQWRQRWPAWMEYYIKPFIARNRIQWRWSKLLHKEEIRKTELYRPQNHMTRDPYCYYYALCVFLGREQFLHVKPPWYLYRPNLWLWRRFLITGKYRHLYLLIEHISRWIGMPDYARRMSDMMLNIVNERC